MSEHLTSPVECPECQHQMNRATNLQGEGVPSDGDFTLCIRCGAILLYAPGPSLRKAQREDLLKLLDEDPGAFKTVMRARMAIAQMRHEQRRQASRWN